MFRRTKRLATDPLYATKLSPAKQKEVSDQIIRLERTAKRVLGLLSSGATAATSGNDDEGGGGPLEEDQPPEEHSAVAAKMSAIHKTLKLRDSVVERDAEWKARTRVEPDVQDMRELRQLSEQVFSDYFLNVTLNEFHSAFYHSDILRKFLGLAKTARHTLNDARGGVRCYREVVWGRGPIYDPRHRYALGEIEAGGPTLRYHAETEQSVRGRSDNERYFLGQNQFVGTNARKSGGTNEKKSANARKDVVVSRAGTKARAANAPISEETAGAFVPASKIAFARNNADDFVQSYREYLRDREWLLSATPDRGDNRTAKLVPSENYLREKLFLPFLWNTATDVETGVAVAHTIAAHQDKSWKQKTGKSRRGAHLSIASML